MRRLGFAAVFLLAVILPVRAGGVSFDDGNASRWMTYYYVEKDTTLVGDYLHWLTGTSLLEKGNTEVPMTAFTATLFAENPSLVRGWVTTEPFEGKAKDLIEQALWQSGHADLIEAVFHEMPAYAREKPVPLLERPLKAPGDFDMIWAAFFASGNTAYPARLIDVLDEDYVFSGNKMLDKAYRASADWSLLSNMRQHELILRMVRRESEKRSGAVQANLKAKLAELDAERVPLPDCDGRFCGLLALISEENLKEFDKPWDQGPFLKMLDKAKAGDKVAIKLCFAQMTLSDDLRADVTYDITVRKPDGTIYAGADLKDIEALKQKVPVSAMVFDNKGILMLRFEDKDPRGTYTVAVVLKDNIGGKKLTLRKTIALTD